MTAWWRGPPRSETVRDVGEKRLIAEIIAPSAGRVSSGVGIGDDAALVPMPPATTLVIATDKIPEDLLALEFGLMTPREHGRYLAEVNISDIAAMGGTPAGLLVNLALPNDFSVAYLREFMRGVADEAQRFGAPIVGGDTGWGSAPCLSATAFGWVPRGRGLLRSGGEPGDRVFVSGEIGGFGAALAYFATFGQEGPLDDVVEAALLERLIRPRARVGVGHELLTCGRCTSCMDITDGLRQSLLELTAASRCGARIHADALPVDAGARAVADLLDTDVLALSLGIGLDLELLGTLRSAGAAAGGGPAVHVIGELTDSPGILELVDSAGSVQDVPGQGWQHFAGNALEQIRSNVRKGRS